MKKLSLVALATMLVGGAMPATAGFYGSLGVGSALSASVEDADADDGAAYAIAVGSDVPLLPVRVEVESFDIQFGDLTYSTDNYGKFSAHGLMLNAYAGLPIPVVSPYIGAGIGKAQTSATEAHASKTESAYQLMAGIELSIPLLPFALGVEYRYLDTSADMDGGSMDISAQSVLLKARISF
ncbi:MAG: porin family protein [Alphaproteobacteria bacterium]|nr:porin family protein [Alphaproteobacteria bacterium]